MDPWIRHGAAALAVLCATVQSAMATEPNTWYVYCEGAGAADHWAVFSENFWPHPETDGYARRVGSAAKAFFETRHDLALEGCAGVNFRDDSLAEHSRSFTVQLHRRLGDRVYFFPLPSEILPADAPAPGIPAASAAADTGSADQAATGGGNDEEPAWMPSTAPR